MLSNPTANCAMPFSVPFPASKTLASILSRRVGNQSVNAAANFLQQKFVRRRIGPGIHLDFISAAAQQLKAGTNVTGCEHPEPSIFHVALPFSYSGACTKFRNSCLISRTLNVLRSPGLNPIQRLANILQELAIEKRR